MFRYLICDDKSIMIALTVTDDVLSVYMRTAPPSEDYQYVLYCSSAYPNIYVERSLREYDQEHARVHSNQKGERDVTHFHMKYKQSIEPKHLHEFLWGMKECEKEVSDGFRNKTFFPKKIIPNVDENFGAFYNKKNVTSSIQSSNSPYYLTYPHHQWPTIAEHENCLRTPKALGCNINREPLIEQNSISAGTALMGGVAMGLIALGIFRFFKSKPSPEKTPPSFKKK